MKFELIATSTFGLEAVVKREIISLGYKIIKTENGKVTFEGNENAIVKANLWLRCADRVLLKMAEFQATESEELFQRIKGLPWEEILPVDSEFPIKVTTVKSTLRSEPNCQKTIKKAIVDRLSDFYSCQKLEETGAKYKIIVTILKDIVTVSIDTTGEGLHKRGYRVKNVPAPIKETLGAALVKMSFWREGRILLDPCCGGGTILIEAAMIGKNIAPGLSRHFISENWDIINKSIWEDEKKNAFAEIKELENTRIIGKDIDRQAIEAANENAIEAGVDDVLSFEQKDVSKISIEGENGVIVTNPPYGERIGEEKDIKKIYEALGNLCIKHKDWSLFIITTDKEAERKIMDKEANRRRKLYNGRKEVCFYQFHGEKPEK